MKTLLIIYYSYTGGTEQLAEAAFAAANQESGAGSDMQVQLIKARDCEPENMLAADGYIFATPENLAAIAGEMKAFFDRCYYPCLGQIEGRPYAAMICAGSDGQNALQQTERIATGWRLKQAMDNPIICTHAQTAEEILAPKTINDTDLAKAAEIGATMAAGIALGVL